MCLCVYLVHIERTEDEKTILLSDLPFHLLISVTLTNINTDKKNDEELCCCNKMPEKDEGIDAKLSYQLLTPTVASWI